MTALLAHGAREHGAGGLPPFPLTRHVTSADLMWHKPPPGGGGEAATEWGRGDASS